MKTLLTFALVFVLAAMVAGNVALISQMPLLGAATVLAVQTAVLIKGVEAIGEIWTVETC